MAETIINLQPETYPEVVSPALIDLKAAWGDEWTNQPELQLVSASWCAGGQDLSACEVTRRYGMILNPGEQSFSLKAAWGDLSGTWLRVRAGDPPEPIWLGQISGHSRQIHGSTAHGPSGTETYVAYGPMQILRKISVGKSFWDGWDGENEIVCQVGWVPGVNDHRQSQSCQAGNRSEQVSEETGCYLHGQLDLWTHLDYCEYLLAMFVDESATGGPTWTIDGQIELLDNLSETIPLSATQTVEQILALLISPQYGIDYVIFANDDDSGFTVWVYSLSSQTYGAGEHEVTGNPNTVVVQAGQSIDQDAVHVVRSNDHGYKTVRVLGKRIVCCFSLAGAGVDEPLLETGSLNHLWHAAIEADYLQPPGCADSPAEECDRARAADKFRGVFTTFSQPAEWDYYGGDAAPVYDQDLDEIVAGDPVDFQVAEHGALNWLPLLEGTDYTIEPPEVLYQGPGWTPDLLPPAAWIGKVPAGEILQTYRPVEQAGISLSAMSVFLGVQLGTPGRNLADGHWGEGAYPSDLPMDWDWENLVVTLAYECDQRLVIELATEDASPSGGILEVEVPDAELWCLAPSTAVAVDVDGALQTSPDAITIVRNDVDRLWFIMAGLVARYQSGRCRAEIRANGLLPWATLCGQILTAVSDGENVDEMDAPITAVRWQCPTGGGGHPTTTIVAGFAS